MNAAANRPDVFPMPAILPSKRAPDDEPPLTVDEFCRRYNMSRSTFYRMRRKGLTPNEMRVGRKGLITLASAREWDRRMVREEKAARETLTKR
jgi:predicted DNA-binding transcriptional regulator AlpA